MYLAIDIGGTKTLLATLNDEGVIQEQQKFPTPPTYREFVPELAAVVVKLSTKDFTAAGVGMPGILDRQRGVGLRFGNLDWRDVPMRSDVQAITKCSVVIENDANLAGLSEAMLLKDEFQRVLYVTVSTGIGIGVIDRQAIAPVLADSEGGQMMLEHDGKIVKWESFASGHAIVERFGKPAHDITDSPTWQIISHNLAVGLIDLIAIIQPEVIVLGGSVATYYERFAQPLQAELEQFQNAMLAIPPIRAAGRPEEAVVYGAYDLAKQTYGSSD